MPQLRRQLCALLSELGTLSGWQALDLGHTAEAWRYYDTARTAAAASEFAEYEAHAMAEQAFVLADIGEHQAAAELTTSARERVHGAGSALLTAWLEATRGETLAHLDMHDDSLRAFDTAAEWLSKSTSMGYERPYIVLDDVHLARWRGNALARLRLPDALPCLLPATAELDSSFSRAHAGLCVDLSIAYADRGDLSTAQGHLERAVVIADRICSARQRRRANVADRQIAAEIS